MAIDKSKLKQERVQRRDVYLLELDQLKIEEGFNVRIDFGDIEELAASIEKHGVKVPIRGFKRGDFYWETDGERRWRACQILAAKGIKLKVPFLSDGKEINQEQRVIDMLICNEGKKLNPVEQSDAVQRLVNYGYTNSEISQSTGYSAVYISNLQLLYSAPKKIKLLIASDVIKSTQVLKMFRETKSFDEVMKSIEAAVSYSESEKGASAPKKVTDSVVKKSQGKINSFSAVKKAIRVAEKRTVRVDKIDLYNTLKKIYDGEYSLEFLMSELYEPETTPEKKEKKSKYIQTAIPD